MKKFSFLLLCLLLLVSLSGCATLTRITSTLEYDTTHTPEPTSAPENSFDATAESEAATEPTPTAEPTPEPTPEPPIEEINAAL